VKYTTGTKKNGKLSKVKILLLLLFLIFVAGISIVLYRIYVFSYRFEKCLYPNLITPGDDLAASANGGTIILYSSEYAPGWEAKNLIDQNYKKGWGTNSEKAAGQWIEVLLPGPLPTTVRQIRINPGPSFETMQSWGLKDFHVDVSTDEVTYTTILKGSFGLQDLGKTNTFLVTPTPARVVRITVDSNQSDFYASQYVDVTELEVYSCSFKDYVQKTYPSVIPISNFFSDTATQLKNFFSGRNNLAVTSEPQVGKYFRLPKETTVRENNLYRYTPYPKTIPAGTVVKITDGPRYTEGQEWWKLSEDEWGGYTGWFDLQQKEPPLTN
jgi:hypothetical protein